MKRVPSLLAIISITSAVFTNGCAVALVGGGAAGTVYITGELKTTEPVSLAKLIKATDAAIKDLGLTTAARRADALTAHYELYGGENKKIALALKSAGEQVTELRIRIGTFGDEALSRSIHERIKKHL